MNEQSEIVSINRKTYANAKVLDYYDGLTELFPAEKGLFEHLSSKIEKARILDIGVGGGRTTQYLLPRASAYTGIDYVPEFIVRVKKNIRLALSLSVMPEIWASSMMRPLILSYFLTTVLMSSCTKTG